MRYNRLDQFQSSVVFHIETSHSFYTQRRANELVENLVYFFLPTATKRHYHRSEIDTKIKQLKILPAKKVNSGIDFIKFCTLNFCLFVCLFVFCHKWKFDYRTILSRQNGFKNDFNPFHFNTFFLYPLKTFKKTSFLMFSKGYIRKRLVAWNSLNSFTSMLKGTFC